MAARPLSGRPRGLNWLPAVLLLGLVLQLLLPWRVQAQASEEEVRRIARQLRCPICESVSVADSPAELAVQMRGIIRKKLEAGENEQQIMEYFATAYGDSVLLEPPRRGLGWLVWLGPPLALGLGGLAVSLLLRVWVKRGQRSGRELDAATGGAGPPPEQATELARQELEAMRRGQGT
jgi:cytochrome c-type biogenesis protein CcmH